jgi:hypothetical protein
VLARTQEELQPQQEMRSTFFFQHGNT